MTPEEITSLGEAAAKAAKRAIRNADKAGADQNRGQFVAMVAKALNVIPQELRGEPYRHAEDRGEAKPGSVALTEEKSMSNRRPSHWDEPLSPLCEHGKGYSCKHCQGTFPFPTKPLPHQTEYRSGGSERQSEDGGRQDES